MKKILLVCVAFVALHATAKAQEFGFGPKVGLNISTLTGADISGVKSKAGFAAGMFFEYNFNSIWAFEGDLLYSAQGAKVKHFDDLKMNINYLNVPLLAKAYVYEGLNFYAGPQIGFLLSSKLKMDGESASFKDEMRNVALGLQIGTGYQLNFGLNVFANYTFGLTNIAKPEDGEGIKMQNGVFQVGLGWRF